MKQLKHYSSLIMWKESERNTTSSKPTKLFTIIEKLDIIMNNNSITLVV